MLTLPITAHIQKIKNLVKESDVLVLSTPTGSGKTLQVPYFLEQEIEGKVFVTVPRVLLAKSAMKGVNSLMYDRPMAGVITGKVNMREHYARLLFCTEGSFINRMQNRVKSNDVLVIDEVHEQGINTEEVLFTSLELAKKGTKIVVMSATMDMAKYIAYYERQGLKVSAFDLPEKERPYKIETIATDNIFKKVIELDETTLMGFAGKADIEQAAQKLKQMGYDGRIFPLHGEIEEWEEKEALTFKGKKIFLATSVAMSGITLNGLKVVVPALMGKRISSTDGKLSAYDLSLAEIKQWEGRVGRESDGVCIYPDIDFKANREANPTPEILRVNLNDVVMNFAAKRTNLANVELLNKPSLENIQTSQNFLLGMGLLNENLTELTDKGRIVLNFGEGLHVGLFIYEGQKLGIESTARKIATIEQYGSPYSRRECRNSYAFIKKLQREDEICKISQHYATLKTIEEDEEAHFTGKATFDVLVRDYAIANGIFMKGVSRIKRQFDRIDAKYNDKEKITKELLIELLSNQMTTSIFVDGYNNTIGYVNSALSGEKLYCKLSPVQTRSGRLAEMTTVLK